jgi:LacI family transcriptional regulator
VLGVDDEAFLCENAHPPLSSVVPDFERQGWLAACAIETMAEGGEAPPPAEVGVRGIVRRASTGGGPSSAGLLVQRALSFIRQRACDGIGVPDVAARLGVSRRLLDLRFREEQGRTVLDAIQERRLDEVRRRLSETDDTIGEIAEACGYGDVSHLRRLFRARFHAGMRTWRESVRRKSPRP